MRLLGGLGDPTGEKSDAKKAHRGVCLPPEERGVLSIMGPGSFFYSKATGAFDVVSSGRNWGRLSSAAHRRALSLIDNKEIASLRFSSEALVLDGGEIFGDSFLAGIFFLMII